MQRFLENLELILTAVGVVVILCIFAIFRNMSPWRAAALCALAIGVVHGIIFYAVRSQQRKARNSAIRAIRYKLNDVIAEKFQLAMLAAEFPNEGWSYSANQALQEIESSLALIEAETLMDPNIYPQTRSTKLGA